MLRSAKYGINDNYLFLKSDDFKNMGHIKQIKIYPPADSKVDIIVIYEVEDIDLLPDNGKYLSIDLGINNPFTCFDSEKENVFILGKQYKSICQYHNKRIAHYQSIAASQQAAEGVKYPKMTKRVQKLYGHRSRQMHDYIHKCTRYIVNYCIEHKINTVVIGDITGIREGNNLGDQNNQVFHAFPKAKIIMQLKCKLRMAGINFIEQKEAYSSQCSPSSAAVSKRYAKKNNRKYRGLYVEGKRTNFQNFFVQPYIVSAFCYIVNKRTKRRLSMYPIVPDKRIWLYDCLQQGWLYLFDSVEDVIKFIASDLRGLTRKLADVNICKSEVKSQYLEQICMHMNECYHSDYCYENYKKLGWSDLECKFFLTRPRYMYINANYQVIDMRIYAKEIEKIAASSEPIEYCCATLFRRKKYKRQYQTANYIYRQTPVPRTGKSRYKRSKTYRHMKTTQELRHNNAPEYREFVRIRRKHLPNVYDDIPIEKKKSWKDCTKRKNQWKEKAKYDSSFSFTTFYVELLI